MKKLVKSSEEIRDKQKNAVRLITQPVVQTLSPKGRNVLYEDNSGSLSLTNDGVTIARQVTSDDPIENAVIEIIKSGALRTNNEAGDGTTTTTLFTSILIEEGWKKIDDGMNPMVLKYELEDMSKMFIDNLHSIKIENDDDLRNVARISANNDDEIAENVVDIVSTAGEDGIVLIEDSPKDTTVVEKNVGFIIDSGIYSPEYAQNNGFTTTMSNCYLLVTDKRLYYKEEVDTIIRTAIEAGIKDLVIVARDFIGKAVNALSHNQVNNERINLLLVKDDGVTQDSNTTVSDLAIYLGGKLISDKHGKLVDSLSAEDFIPAQKVFANPKRTVISPLNPQTKELENLIESLKQAKEDDEEDESVSRRLACLTSGMVTVKVGGATPVETKEKIFRYEDAINATRSAMKDGYLLGGGLGIMSAYKPEMFTVEMQGIARKIAESSIRQIAKNCGEHEEHILKNCNHDKGVGYNAQTGEFVDLAEVGIIDPFKVTELALRNAVSVANAILTSGWIIVNEKEEEE